MEISDVIQSSADSSSAHQHAMEGSIRQIDEGGVKRLRLRHMFLKIYWRSGWNQTMGKHNTRCTLFNKSGPLCDVLNGNTKALMVEGSDNELHVRNPMGARTPARGVVGQGPAGICRCTSHPDKGLDEGFTYDTQNLA